MIQVGPYFIHYSFNLGFFTCLTSIQNAVLRSIQLLRKFQSLFMNCQISFGAIHQIIIWFTSFFIFHHGFFQVFIACWASLKSCMNGAELKFQLVSTNFTLLNILKLSIFKYYIKSLFRYYLIFSFPIKIKEGIVFLLDLLFEFLEIGLLFVCDSLF